jgi:endoglucanase
VNTKRVPAAIGLLAFAAAWFFCVAAAAEAAEAGAGFGRGIGISHAMAWARVEPGPARAFAFPPFSDPWNALTLDELQTLRRTGFDFVRLAVDPGPFLQFQGTRRAALDRILLERVNLILSSGLAIVVDFQPSDLHPDYTAGALTSGLATPVFQAYLRLVERTAALLDTLHSDKVALELMNEPPVPQEAWQPMLEASYAAARRGAANLPLILEGGEQASAAALTAMRIGPFAKDPAALFAFHFYDPYQFTHQGAPWNDARYLADVPYPALARPVEDSLEATAALVAKTDLPQRQKSSALRDAQMRLASYRRSAFDDAAIAKAFDRIADWARAQGVPSGRIMLGEFGARQTARADERAQWFHDVREQAQAHGFGWAVWAYRGEGGFALADAETGNGIDARVAAALGLNAHPQHKAAAMPPTGAFDRVP